MDENNIDIKVEVSRRIGSIRFAADILLNTHPFEDKKFYISLYFPKFVDKADNVPMEDLIEFLENIKHIREYLENSEELRDIIFRREQVQGKYEASMKNDNKEATIWEER